MQVRRRGAKCLGGRSPRQDFTLPTALRGPCLARGHTEVRRRGRRGNSGADQDVEQPEEAQDGHHHQQHRGAGADAAVDARRCGGWSVGRCVRGSQALPSAGTGGVKIVGPQMRLMLEANRSSFESSFPPLCDFFFCFLFVAARRYTPLLKDTRQGADHSTGGESTTTWTFKKNTTQKKSDKHKKTQNCIYIQHNTI